MSIKKSLRLSIILISSLPLIFMAVLTYILSLGKYLELAKASAEELAKTYSQGFEEQIDVQIAEVEGLSNAASVQSITLEYYNSISTGSSSTYYEPVHELLKNTSKYMNYNVDYYIYDLNGYFIVSSDENAAGDWIEYMETPISDIRSTTILKSSNISSESNCIELVTPIVVKDKTVGLMRAKISSKYFGDFVPEDGTANILLANGECLFEKSVFDIMTAEKITDILEASGTSGYVSTKRTSVKNIYGFSKIENIEGIGNLEWIYIIRQSGRQYQKVLTTLPLTFFLTLVIVLCISVYISDKYSNKFTAPILTLKNNMAEATAGNLDVKCKIESNDELGDLSNNFNTMMNIISNNYGQIVESKKALESNEAELQKSYAHIEQLAYHDALTGLYNRVAFLKLANEIFQNDGADLKKHSIFFIDLDDFKNVNDTLGHEYGDMLLMEVSNQLSASIAKEDILARTGGDEFLIFKSNFESIEALSEFAQSILDIIDKPFNLDGESARISMSIGIAIFPRDGLTTSELIKNADIAMYSAKMAGKNNYCFFDSYMEDDFTRKNDLAEILNNVIEKKEVYLMYQPQISITEGHITGFEALMRIESESIGYIAPTEFIPIAESSGAINRLGEWALYEACAFNQSLTENGYGPFKVSVNVSTTQLHGSHLIDVIRSIPEKTGMSLENLEIEITESVLMDSFDHNLELINDMKKLGVSIALDDFGTGYSSFNYLTQIPIDTLKIDKSFVDDICTNVKDRCISDAIIALAHKMDISVVAEGVEDEKQLSILKEQSCDTLQGYLFSKPLRAPAFENLLELGGKKHRGLGQ